MPLDRVRLLKLLQMTRSGSDGEALNAVRMANALLDREGESWEAVLGLLGEPDPFPAPPPPRDPSAEWRSSAFVDQAWETDSEPSFRPGEFLGVRIRWTLRHIPLSVRLLLFPLWFACHAVADVLEASRPGRRILLVLVAAGGTALMGMVWLVLAGLVVEAVGRLWWA